MLSHILQTLHSNKQVQIGEIQMERTMEQIIHSPTEEITEKEEEVVEEEAVVILYVRYAAYQDI